jgi:hypothetical protein
VHDLAQKAQDFIKEPSGVAHALDCLEKISLLAQYTLTAAVDVANFLAWLNADVARKLHSVWIDQSRLLVEVKDAVKTAPVAEGIAPTEKGTESCYF